MTLEVPFNTKANLILNQKDLETLTINGVPFNDFQKKNKVQMIDNSTLVLGSGLYAIAYKFL